MALAASDDIPALGTPAARAEASVEDVVARPRNASVGTLDNAEAVAHGEPDVDRTRDFLRCGQKKHRARDRDTTSPMT